MVATGWAPERRELQIREGGGLSGGTSVNINIKLGAYASRFTNPSLAGILVIRGQITGLLRDLLTNTANTRTYIN